jgi:Zn-finger protein
MDINAHINQIIIENSFKNRSKNYPDACPCYTNKPCHEMTDLNCLLCYCPKYNTEIKTGGCKINNPNGKWHYNDLLSEKKIWDCSACTYPHSKEVVKEYLTKLFEDKKE